MAALFSDEWMKLMMEEWNKDPEVSGKLAEINFNSTIGCGFKGEEKPMGVFVVEDGIAVRAGTYDGETLNWDMRADKDNWMKWMNNGLGMTGMGMAVTTGKLKFLAGDFKSMFKDPRMATPFVKSFGLMGRVGGE